MTKEEKKNLLILSAVIAVVLVLYLFWDDIKGFFKKPEYVEEPQPKNTGTGTNNSTATTSAIKAGDSVKAGKNGATVYSKDATTKLSEAKPGAFIGNVNGVGNSGYTGVTASGKAFFVTKTSVVKA